MAWYDSSWNYRIKITIDHTKVSSDITDYPLLILEDNSSNDLLDDNFWSNVKSDGSDIVITRADGITKLPRELVAIDTTNQTMELYTKYNFSSSVDTDIYLYYGNSTASEINDSSTWGNYSFVVHFEGDTDDSSSGITSSYESLSYTSSGKIGQAGSFDGSSDYVKYSNATGIDVGTYDKDFTFSAWIYGDTFSSHERVVMSKDGYPTTNREWQFHVQTDSKLRTLVFFSDGSHSGNNLYATTAMSTSTWYYLTATYDGSIMRIYINGTQEDTYSTTKAQKDGNGNLAIGKIPESDYNYFDGYIDECRIGKCISSDDITTTYNNTNSPATFYTSSSQETNTPTGRKKQIVNVITM